MRLAIGSVALALFSGVALVGCGSDSSSSTSQPTGTVVLTGVGPVAELVATGDASEWGVLTAESKQLVVARYLAVRGSSVTSADLVAALDLAFAAGAAKGTLRQALDVLASALPSAEPSPATTETQPAPEPVPVPVVEPDPDGTFTYRCDYLLGDFSETSSGYRFVADATLKNTGNIGTVDRVTAIWDQIGGEAVKSTKTVRTRAGKTRKVQFNLTATQGQIDAHQSADSECRVAVRIARTYGVAR